MLWVVAGLIGNPLSQEMLKLYGEGTPKLLTFLLDNVVSKSATNPAIVYSSAKIVCWGWGAKKAFTMFADKTCLHVVFLLQTQKCIENPFM